MCLSCRSGTQEPTRPALGHLSLNVALLLHERGVDALLAEQAPARTRIACVRPGPAQTQMRTHASSPPLNHSCTATRTRGKNNSPMHGMPCAQPHTPPPPPHARAAQLTNAHSPIRARDRVSHGFETQAARVERTNGVAPVPRALRAVPRLAPLRRREVRRRGVVLRVP